MIKTPKWLADLGLRINRLYYKQLFESIYRGKNPPAWFDHRIDLHYHWPHNLFWLERGILPRKHMMDGCTVLDLFCGDGFFSRYFYATIAGHIDAVDKDPKAISHARRWHSHSKVNYVVGDAVKEGFPRPHYDVIVWFEGVEHLEAAECKVVLDRIEKTMGKGGVLVGSTPLVSPHNLKPANWEHQNEFASVEALREFLARDFVDVSIFTTVYPELDGGKRRTAHFTVRGARQ
jgi:2-polyprenyl-3-methyl-5-hydroxy-6-metoxy-1,4-benzoquinol methylase